MFKNVNYGNRSHKEFGSLQSILQVSEMLSQDGLLIGTSHGCLEFGECTGDTAASMTGGSVSAAIA